MSVPQEPLVPTAPSIPEAATLDLLWPASPVVVTARAHALGRTHDWAVVFVTTRSGEGRRTIVTEARGPLAGLRVLRGREADRPSFHAALIAPGTASARSQAEGA